MKVIKFLEDLIFLSDDANIKKDDIYVVYDFSDDTVNYVELFKYEENPKHYVNELGFVGIGYTVPYKLKKSTLKQLFNDNVIKEICEVGEKEEISTTIEQIKDKNKKITEEFIENEIMNDMVNILNCFAEVREGYKGDSYCFKNNKVVSPNRVINIDIDYIKNHDKSLVVDKIIKELNKEIECFNKNTTKITFNAPIVDDKDNLVIIQYGYLNELNNSITLEQWTNEIENLKKRGEKIANEDLKKYIDKLHGLYNILKELDTNKSLSEHTTDEIIKHYIELIPYLNDITELKNKIQQNIENILNPCAQIVFNMGGFQDKNKIKQIIDKDVKNLMTY